MGFNLNLLFKEVIIITAKGHCNKCGEFELVVITRGRALCDKCFGVCVFCGKEKVIAKFAALGKPICKECYPKKLREKPKEAICIACNQKKLIYALGCCYACYLKNWRQK